MLVRLSRTHGDVSLSAQLQCGHSMSLSLPMSALFECNPKHALNVFFLPSPHYNTGLAEATTSAGRSHLRISKCVTVTCQTSCTRNRSTRHQGSCSCNVKLQLPCHQMALVPPSTARVASPSGAEVLCVAAV